MREAHSIAVQEKRKDCYGTLITFSRTLLEYSMRGSSCAKTVPHKQRKGLLGMDSKENKPRRSTASKAKSPRCPACVGLCEAFPVEVGKQYPDLYHPLFGLFFQSVWEGRIFPSRCGSSGARWDQNPMHKSAAFDEFYSLSQRAVFPGK